MVYHTNNERQHATMKAKHATTISLDAKLLEAARKEAKAQRRSLSAQLEVWMEEKLGVRSEEHAPMNRTPFEGMGPEAPGHMPV
ncbi:hypothetical protein OKA04_23265 [Luteolibacter flavescens]|uniref:Uncharacterized protein n=1 Tax=Luteolibacter flavescens TaxID=1859460 RepID=A0ABT3FWQ3_9BACT|nr:hypothetical protein [Luteolibacter flavescens]MCW1887676.1 hypothetical protein [Luteolibacter flavescens]